MLFTCAQNSKHLLSGSCCLVSWNGKFKNMEDVMFVFGPLLSTTASEHLP